eukprot:605106-Amphidinium_carterae.1
MLSETNNIKPWVISEIRPRSRNQDRPGNEACFVLGDGQRGVREPSPEAVYDPGYGQPLTVASLEPDYNEELQRYVSLEEQQESVDIGQE